MRYLTQITSSGSVLDPEIAGGATAYKSGASGGNIAYIHGCASGGAGGVVVRQQFASETNGAVIDELAWTANGADRFGPVSDFGFCLHIPANCQIYCTITNGHVTVGIA